MTIISDIRSSARATLDALRDKMETDVFATFSERINLVSVGFSNSVENLLLSGSSGSEAQRQAAARAAQAARGMQPNEGSVSSALATINGASDTLDQRASAGFLESLRGSLRLTNFNAITPAFAPSRGPILEGVAPPAGDPALGGMRVATAGDGGPPKPPSAGDPNYYQKLTNLFPAEALALYGTGVALFSGANAFVVVSALVVLLLLRWFANEPAGGGQTHVVAVLVAAVSYLLWATASDPSWIAPYLQLTQDQADALRRGAAFIGAAVVLLAPLVVKAPPPEQT